MQPCSRIAHHLTTYALLFAFVLHAESDAQEAPVTSDGWVQQRDERSGVTVHTKELTIHPQAEPKPALKHRLLINEYDAVDVNAAVPFLQAMGFIEREAARESNYAFIQDSFVKAKQQGKDAGELPPWSWLATAPNDLPLEEVKKYLEPLSFQVPLLREAARRNRFDLGRNFRGVDDPIGYPLAEIQQSRELARAQSLRCRVAIAEDRTGDAMEIIGQQFAMARHLGRDDFLISSLVGMGFVITAWNDMFYLVQEADAPNMYWALAMLPSPLVDTRRAMSIEHQFLYHQLKVLREVNDTPKSDGYWQDFIERLLPQLGSFAAELDVPEYHQDPDAARDALLAHIEAGYAKAKAYLMTEQMMPREQVEAYPEAQVVFLAIVRHYDHWRDEVFKWMHLPFWQARRQGRSSDLEQAMKASSDRYGWCARPTQALAPGLFAARVAEARCQQSIALIQTVECLRMYAAANNGELPGSLDDLAVPAPIEPFTGRPVDYRLDGAKAIINGHELPGLQYRLIVRVAK